MIASGDLTIQPNTDTNQDGAINGEDVDAQIQRAAPNDDDIITFNGRDYTYNASDWSTSQTLEQLKQAFMASRADSITPAEARQQLQDGRTRTEVVRLFREYQSAEQALQRAQQTNNQQNIQQATENLERVRNQLQTQVQYMQQLNQAANRSTNANIPSEILDALGISRDGNGNGRGNTAAMTTSQQPAANQSRAITTPAPQANFTPPSGWAAQTTSPNFSTDAYMQSVAMEDNILGSFDSILKNQNKGKQLMMLFFYFAKMAESGDLGAMYQFMKFLTYIISKDKAKQQIDMGKKLIELQDLSRKWTDKLLGFQTNASDPNSSNDFMKVMTEVKSETDAIATSQKLIAQMMEEFAQIVETLTNTTKGALDAQGRVLRNISRMS